MIDILNELWADFYWAERNAALFSFNLGKVRAYLMREGGWKLESFPSDHDLEIAMYMTAAKAPTVKYRKRQQEAQMWIIQHIDLDEDLGIEDYKWLRSISNDRLIDMILDASN